MLYPTNRRYLDLPENDIDLAIMAEVYPLPCWQRVEISNPKQFFLCLQYFSGKLKADPTMLSAFESIVARPILLKMSIHLLTIIGDEQRKKMIGKKDLLKIFTDFNHLLEPLGKICLELLMQGDEWLVSLSEMLNYWYLCQLIHQQTLLPLLLTTLTNIEKHRLSPW